MDWKSWGLAEVAAIIPLYQSGEGRCAGVYLRKGATGRGAPGDGGASTVGAPFLVPLSPASLLRRLLARRGYAYEHA
ncbi:MAG: hypothetical protein OWT27_06310, partial [Firmicutes bacterium]|nr:hypothetical protein [Bacillota bacterium]